MTSVAPQEEDDHSAETADVEAAKGGDVSAAAPSKFCEGIFPLHNMELKNALWVKWIPFKKPSGYDWAGVPVQDIMNYFGEEVRQKSLKPCVIYEFYKHLFSSSQLSLLSLPDSKYSRKLV
jgi:hypothetical protein